MITFDEWLASHDPMNWEKLRDMIRSQEIPASVAAELMEGDPQFAAWLNSQGAMKENWRRAAAHAARRLTGARDARRISNGAFVTR